MYCIYITLDVYFFYKKFVNLYCVLFFIRLFLTKFSHLSVLFKNFSPFKLAPKKISIVHIHVLQCKTIDVPCLTILELYYKPLYAGVVINDGFESTTLRFENKCADHCVTHISFCCTWCLIYIVFLLKLYVLEARDSTYHLS